MGTGTHERRDELTSEEVRARAREYRLMAARATTAKVRDALLAMARILERRAAEKEAESVT